MARAMRAVEMRGRMRETWGMSQEDSKSAQPMSRHIEEWAERRMRNIVDTYITKVVERVAPEERPRTLWSVP